MAVPLPHPALPIQQARIIVEHGRRQHRLWTWCVALAIFALLLVTLFDWIGPAFWGWTISPSRARVLAQLDLLALGVLILEMATQFKSAKNKVLFLQKNWLLVLALLPFGALIRAFRVFEGLEAVRVFQMWGKVGELRVVAPNLEIPFLSPILSPFAAAIRSFSQWSGLDELLELVSRLVSSFSR